MEYENPNAVVRSLTRPGQSPLEQLLAGLAPANAASLAHLFMTHGLAPSQPIELYRSAEQAPPALPPAAPRTAFEKFLRHLTFQSPGEAY